MSYEHNIYYNFFINKKKYMYAYIQNERRKENKFKALIIHIFFKII